jgi:hypothetical protein
MGVSLSIYESLSENFEHQKKAMRVVMGHGLIIMIIISETGYIVMVWINDDGRQSKCPTRMKVSDKNDLSNIVIDIFVYLAIYFC